MFIGDHGHVCVASESFRIFPGDQSVNLRTQQCGSARADFIRY